MNVEQTSILLKGLISTIDTTKPMLAIELYYAKKNIIWQDTEYGNWVGYCNVEIPLSQTTIYKYLKTGELITKYEYSLDAIGEMVKAIGWARTQLGLTKIDSHMPVDVFITMFKDVNLNQRVTYDTSTDSHLTQFSFELPEHAASILTGELMARGMRDSNGYRTNASEAMRLLIKDLMGK